MFDSARVEKAGPSIQTAVLLLCTLTDGACDASASRTLYVRMPCVVYIHALDDRAQFDVKGIAERRVRDDVLLFALAKVCRTAHSLSSINQLRRNNKVLGRNLFAQRTDSRERKDSTRPKVLERGNVRRKGYTRWRERVVHTVTGKERHQCTRTRARDRNRGRREAPRLRQHLAPIPMRTVSGRITSTISRPSSLYRPLPPITPTRTGETRPRSSRLGWLSRADGSAHFATGKYALGPMTTNWSGTQACAASVVGPIEVRLRDELTDSATFQVLVVPLDGSAGALPR